MLAFLDLFLFIIGFLLGSIPFGYIFSRLKGVDIRKAGSGNIGATNVTRILGAKVGIIVGIFDFLKGFIFVLFISKIYHPSEWKLFFLCFAPILGHVFTPWLNFKGGKGVSTLVAALFVIFNWQIILITLSIWFVLFRLTRIMSLTNLVLAIILPVLFFINFRSLISVIFGALFGLFIFWTHRSNIERLLRGKELKFKDS